MLLSCFLAFIIIVQITSTVEPTLVEPSARSRYEAHRTLIPIIIDGNITDTEWQHAAVMANFSDVFQPERPVKYPTSARMLWDDRYLYVAFECHDEHIWGTKTTFDAPVYLEEAVEIFIDPEGQGKFYYEIDVSPANVVVDLMIPSAERLGCPAAVSYNVKGLRTATRIFGTLNNRADRDEKWTVEIAIPFSEFAARKVNIPPKPGDTWRMNLFRIDRPVPAEPDDVYVSWSKSPGVFHQPMNFGELVFVK